MPVAPDHFRVQGLAVIEGYGDHVNSLHHVIVCEDVTVAVYYDASAKPER